MAQELVYTSAPRGLKPGSRGFCTVEATAGLPPTLVTALESLSGYRHVAPPGDPANPVVHSHVTISLGGRTYSVLSRIADAGTDYTGRTNKLAHHVALDAAERPTGGPAWLVGQSGLLRERFEGEPRTLPPRSISSGDRPAAVCKAWQAATGDAGWAGVIAEAFLADPNRAAAYFVVPPDLDVRTLFEEAIALLPLDRRWGVTFTTLYTSLPQTVNCLWRAVLAGSKEAHESRRFVQALRLDLTEPLGAATGGVLVEAARSGRVPVAATRKPQVAGVAALAGGLAAEEEDAPLDVMPGARSPRPERLIETLALPPKLRRRSRVRTALWVGAGVVCLAVMATPVVLGVVYWGKGKGPIAVSSVAVDDAAPGDAKNGNQVTDASVASKDGDAPAEEEQKAARETPPIEQAEDANIAMPERVTEAIARSEAIVEPGARSTQAGAPIEVDAAPPDAAHSGAGLPNREIPTQPAPGTQPPTPAGDPDASQPEETIPFEVVVLKQIENEKGRYVAEQVTIAKDELGDISLELWLPKSVEGKYEVSAGGTNDISVLRVATTTTQVCRIKFDERSKSDMQLTIDVDDSELNRLLPIAVLEMSHAGRSGMSARRLLLRTLAPGADDFPRQFSNGTLEWKPAGVPTLLADALQLKHVTIDWLGGTYQFRPVGDAIANIPQTLLSDDLKRHFEARVRSKDFRRIILDDQPRMEFVRDGATWQLQMKPGTLWSGFKDYVADSLFSKRLTYSNAWGLKRQELDKRSLDSFLSYDGLFGEGSEGKSSIVRKQFDRACNKVELEIANLRSAHEKAKDANVSQIEVAQQKLNSIKMLQNDYEEHLEAAKLSGESREAFWNAKIVAAEVVYSVQNGDVAVEVPFRTFTE